MAWGSAYSMRRSAYSMRRSAYNMRKNAYSMGRSAYSMSRSAYSMRRSAYSMRRSADPNGSELTLPVHVKPISWVRSGQKLVINQRIKLRGLQEVCVCKTSWSPARYTSSQSDKLTLLIGCAANNTSRCTNVFCCCWAR